MQLDRATLERWIKHLDAIDLSQVSTTDDLKVVRATDVIAAQLDMVTQDMRNQLFMDDSWVMADRVNTSQRRGRPSG